MANRQMGEIEFQVDGVTYVLRLDINSAIAAQEDCGIKDDFQFLLAVQTCQFRLGLLRAFFFRSGRIGPKGDRFASLEKAGHLVTQLTAEGSAALVKTALHWFLPPEEEAPKEAAGGEPRPSDGPTST